VQEISEEGSMEVTQGGREFPSQSVDGAATFEADRLIGLTLTEKGISQEALIEGRADGSRIRHDE
jgi:hypothetical protein